MRDPKFVFFNRRPGLFEPFDYRSPYAFDSFAKWIMNTLGQAKADRGADDRSGAKAQELGTARRGPGRRLGD